jgi:hypothetical protein
VLVLWEKEKKKNLISLQNEMCLWVFLGLNIKNVMVQYS